MYLALRALLFKNNKCRNYEIVVEDRSSALSDKPFVADIFAEKVLRSSHCFKMMLEKRCRYSFWAKIR